MTANAPLRSLRSHQRAGAGCTRARGQASVFVVIVAAILVIAALLVYNSGRAVVTRIHLQNAADSAAYSGAVELARAYNFAAYSNRAMVANQVAIAQMVGLTSWARYYCLIYTDAECSGPFSTDGTAEEITTLLELFQPGDPGVPTMDAYQTITGPLESGINTASGPIVSLLNIIEQTLSIASRAYYTAALADLGLSALPYNPMDPGVMWRVLRATDPNAQIANATLGTVGVAGEGATALSVGEIYKFTKTYNPQGASSTADPNNRFHNVVMASRDAFDKGRSSAEVLPFDTLISAFGDCFGDGIGGIDVFSLGYSGSTMLSTDNKTWTTKNTANPLGDFSMFLAAGVCVINIPTPIGDIPVPIPLVVPVAPAQSWANVTAGTKTPSYTLKSSRYSGLQKYMDVSTLNKADYTAPVITLFAMRQQDTIGTTQQLNAGTQGANPQHVPIAGGNLALTDDEGHQLMTVSATSQVYFVRPTYVSFHGHFVTQVGGLDNSLGDHTLYASLFSPYWEAHLVPTSPIMKSAVLSAEMAP